MKRRSIALALRVLGLGWYVSVSIVLGVAGGLWLDRYLDTLPIFTIVGVLLGSALAFYGMYKLIAPFNGSQR